VTVGGILGVGEYIDYWTKILGVNYCALASRGPIFDEEISRSNHQRQERHELRATLIVYKRGMKAPLSTPSADNQAPLNSPQMTD
jgi:hypothetical protein